MDSHNYWRIERWRIVLVLFLALLGGLLSGYQMLSLVAALVGYISWLLYKIYQLHQWLEKGASALHLPDNNGIWGRLVQQIQRLQKKSQARKKRMSKLLKRFQGVVTGLPYATIVLNRHNEIDWANKAANEYLSIDLKKDRGQRIDNLIRMPEVLKILRKNTCKEIEIALPQHSDRQIAVQLIPVQDDLKLFIARDVSERNTIQRMRKNFIANASHELRTPLTVISGYLEMISDDENLAESLQPAVQSAAEQAARMQCIIEDLLTLSRLENSELNNDAEQLINMPAVLHNICDDQTSFIVDDSHILKGQIDPTLKIRGAEAEVISVCSNLIHNAVRHTEKGTLITVEWQKNRLGEACLKVSDNGQGIPEKHLPRLTERFYRVDKGRSRDKGGTGLGLAIVQHIIKRHGGYLEIESTLGRGSCFTVCLPVERVIEEVAV